MSGALPSVGTLLGWWLRELGSLVPRRLRALLSPPPLMLEVWAQETATRLRLVSHWKVEAETSPGNAPTRQSRRMARAADNVVMRLDRAHILYPRIRLPLDAGADIAAALRGEIDRHTPFRAADVLFDWRVRGSDLDLGRIELDVAVALRSVVEAGLERVAELGLTADRVDGPVAADGVGFNLLPVRQRPRPSRRPVLLAVLWIAVGAIALAWVLMAFETRRAELERLEDRLAEYRVANREVVAMEERLEALLAAEAYLVEKRDRTPRGLDILAAVTESLPDTAWLHSLSYNDGTLRIDGLASEASGLPALLSASAGFDNVAFASSVRREPGRSFERFGISASVAAPEPRK